MNKMMIKMIGGVLLFSLMVGVLVQIQANALKKAISKYEEHIGE